MVRELFVRPVDSDLFPNYNLLAIVPPDPSLGVDVPLVVDGRAPDPDAIDEITISEDFARSLGVGVGDRLALESMSDEWVDVAFNGGDPGPIDGPTVDAEVVGLARTPADFGRVEGVIELSPAFADEFATRIRTYTSVEAKLTDTSVQQVGPGGGDDSRGSRSMPRVAMVPCVRRRR